MIEQSLIKALLEAGVHFGHQTHRWNPKMKRFIYGEKNGIYVVDLRKTAEGLMAAKSFLRSVAAEGGAILFVGTKQQAQAIVQEEATRCGQFYVNFRWLGGLLTNFVTIRRSVTRLTTIRAWKEDGTMTRMTKKEASRLEKELARLERSLSGILTMERLPQALVVVDAKREETAIHEANRLGIPVVALVDTNSDPDPIAYVIPGNDDSIRSIRLILSHLADAILEGRQVYLAGQPETKAQAEAKEATLPPSALEPSVVESGQADPSVVASAASVDESKLAEGDIEEIVPEGVLRAKIKEAETEPRKRRPVRPKEEDVERKEKMEKEGGLDV